MKKATASGCIFHAFSKILLANKGMLETVDQCPRSNPWKVLSWWNTRDANRHEVPVSITLFSATRKDLPMNPLQCVAGTSNPSAIVFQNPTPLRNHMIALTKIAFVRNWFNCAAEYGTNILRYTNAVAQTFSFNLIDGFYTVSDLNTVLHNYMTSLNQQTESEDGTISFPITLMANTATNRLEVIQRESYKFVLVGSMHTLFGFDAAGVVSAENGIITSPNLPDMDRGIKSIYVECSNVPGTMMGSRRVNAIYSLTTTAGPFEMVKEVPSTFVYVPLVPGVYSSIPITLKDQQGRLINLNGEYWECTFDLREVPISNTSSESERKKLA